MTKLYDRSFGLVVVSQVFFGFANTVMAHYARWIEFLGGALDDIGYSGAVSGEYEQFKYMAQVLNNDPAEGARITYDEMNALHKLTYG